MFLIFIDKIVGILCAFRILKNTPYNSGKLNIGYIMKFKMLKAAFVGLILTVSGLANAALIPFVINQTFSQGSATSDIAEVSVSLGGAGAFTVDPGFSNFYFDFVFPGAGTFSTISTAIEGYFFLNSYQIGETVGAANFGSNVSDSGDWDTILVFNQTAGVWGSDHSGYLGFLTSDSLYGWISYNFTRESDLSTISFLSGAYNDVANADARISVPEPSTLVILALGLIGLGARRFKK